MMRLHHRWIFDVESIKRSVSDQLLGNLKAIKKFEKNFFIWRSASCYSVCNIFLLIFFLGSQSYCFFLRIEKVGLCHKSFINYQRLIQVCLNLARKLSLLLSSFYDLLPLVAQYQLTGAFLNPLALRSKIFTAQRRCRKMEANVLKLLFSGLKVIIKITYSGRSMWSQKIEFLYCSKHFKRIYDSVHYNWLKVLEYFSASTIFGILFIYC